ncbi:left-right determination factor 2-like isoform X1 [Corvus hawaiiensis]|uniref:left-right determination factor 2-like isoform X1 n=1 Tax=Corvus hawaiiensis TaxID=134902 RepID=UPI002019AAD3|nr:left-right determination factor 2-like isoform X1 [Corvus hawaiiensis]XP_048155414.1 left-right determination factor 2-like isoform X1 [Corvus hawaiiensis]XP_048155415.1 left-right determination factor 2-like isoform X1 [Corvus hawaiiensis]XP_048155416.1 left-right determination factor 2-like isoform X1 [Corvus hawaiiensis]XP_048155417.1 left-right determination factor 2-like isoform X1 [Corvus hawaiiensis]XP_048155418.1 left-right determination factor 2-like isoform X1 [Corvus hawaiiensis]
MDLRCAGMLFMLCLVLTVQGFTQEGFKEVVLKQLGLSEVPKLHKRDLVDLVIPEHVKNKYMSMLKRQRVKRRALPSLAGILRAIPGHTGMTGEVLYSDTITRQKLMFDMEGRIPKNSEVTMAELKLFQKPLDRANLPAKQSHRPISNARVSVYWVHDGTNRTSLIDSRLVPIYESGWKSFDVTQAVHYWLRNKRREPMFLEVWIEGERVGSYASEMAKAVRFTSQDPKDKALGKPELVLYTLYLDDYGSPGDCREEALMGKSTCCRQKHYISFRELSWAQHWILEPAGFQAYRCSGSCLQPPRALRRLGSGQRSCAAAGSSALPVIYLVKRGNSTEIEAAEFPNMIVERCSCVTDGVALV